MTRERCLMCALCCAARLSNEAEYWLSMLVTAVSIAVAAGDPVSGAWS